MGVPVMAKDVGAAGTKLAVYDKTITQHQVRLILSSHPPFRLLAEQMRPVLALLLS